MNRNSSDPSLWHLILYGKFINKQYMNMETVVSSKDQEVSRIKVSRILKKPDQCCNNFTKSTLSVCYKAKNCDNDTI